MHLADAFIQSDLQSFEVNPMKNTSKTDCTRKLKETYKIVHFVHVENGPFRFFLLL